MNRKIRNELREMTITHYTRRYKFIGTPICMYFYPPIMSSQSSQFLYRMISNQRFSCPPVDHVLPPRDIPTFPTEHFSSTHADSYFDGHHFRLDQLLRYSTTIQDNQHRADHPTSSNLGLPNSLYSVSGNTAQHQAIVPQNDSFHEYTRPEPRLMHSRSLDSHFFTPSEAVLPQAVVPQYDAPQEACHHEARLNHSRFSEEGRRSTSNVARIRRFRCRHCLKAFSRKIDRKRHINSVRPRIYFAEENQSELY